MTPERWRQIKQILQEALELEAGARAEFLDHQCAGDDPLRREVESLIEYAEEPESPFPASPIEEAIGLLASVRDQLEPGQAIGHYRALALLGRGGMGEVYAAEDLRLGRKVALKVLPASSALGTDRTHRLEQEARAASSLNHPNIITVHEVGEAYSLRYIAMEYVEGETLRQRMRGSPIGIREALDVAAQVAGALQRAHQAGIVHRDIKPENIMVRSDGYVKVLDFGIAKLKEPDMPSAGGQSTSDSGTRDGLTAEPPTAESEPEPSAVLGTVSYMSPEQARLESLDGRTDLFSLGVVLYEAIARRRPFERETPQATIRALLNDKPARLSKHRTAVPQYLEAFVEKALAKDRDQRYQSAGEFLSELKRVLHQLEPRSHTGDDRLRGTAPRPRGNGLRHRLAGFFRRESVRPADSAAMAGAFRGLAPFGESDQACFYGRDLDTTAALEMIMRRDFRFGVLYGDSGTGKTSLLTAGIIPGIKQVGYLPIYCRSYRNPVAALVEECRRLSEIEPREAEPPFSYLLRVAEARATSLFVIWDQFEEFFFKVKTKRDREPFTSFVTECHRAAGAPVKFLFSIRSDFLHFISLEFDGRIPEPLMGDKRYQLRSFDQEQAEQIIEKSARQAYLPFETALCRQVASDLAAGDSVLPSELQIVGQQLQSKRIYTLKAYQQAGGKEQLVYSFLEDAIQASGDRQVAGLFLRSLIWDDNTRLTLPLNEIARRSQLGREKAGRILNLFVESRLVREIQEESPWRYELMHDYLIERVNQITGRVMDATQRANRLFRQYLSQYAADSRTRIPLARLWSIRRHADLECGDRGRELLRKSLRSGLALAVGMTLLFLMGAVAVAAWASEREDWTETVFRDGHSRAARQAAFSPDGRLLVSVGEDGKVIVWDFAGRMPLAILPDHTKPVTSVAFSTDGRWFATASEDESVIVWDASRFQKQAVLNGQGKITAVAFSPDGRLLAAAAFEPKGSPDGRVMLWAVGSWKKLRELPARVGDYGRLIFSPDGRWLSCTQAQKWSTATWEQVAPDIANPANWAALSPDAARMAVMGSGGDIELLNLTKRTIKNYPGVHQDHGRAAAFSQDGRFLATGADDIVLWDARSMTNLGRLKHPAIVWNVVFSPDSRWLVSTHGDGSVLVWDVAQRSLAANLNGHGEAVRAVAFSPDGKHVASGGEDRSVIVWSAETCQKETVLLGNPSAVTSVAFSHDGSRVASCGQKSKALMWDVVRKESTLPFDEAMSASYCVTFSTDDHWLATTQAVYDANDAHKIVDLARPSFYGVAFSRDGRWLACASPSQEAPGVRLLDTQNWQVREQLDTSDAHLITVSFSPDGKFIVTGDDEGNVRLWAINPLRQIALLGRHNSRIKCVTFSPDGRAVASAGDDNAIRMWDVNGRRLIREIGTHTAPVLSVAFSPDGKRLVSGEHDHSVRLYARHRMLWGRPMD